MLRNSHICKIVVLIFPIIDKNGYVLGVPRNVINFFNVITALKTVCYARGVQTI